MAGWRRLGVAGAEAYESCVKERGERQELWLLLSVDFIMIEQMLVDVCVMDFV